MKYCFFIAILLCELKGVRAQETFFDVYNQVIAKEDIYRAKYIEIDRSTIDTASKKEMRRKEFQAYKNEVAPVLRKIVNLTFPDISFTDVNGKVYSISDFKEDVIINYNYMFCASCIKRIDLTLEKTANKKNLKLLVLFSEIYRKDFALLKNYGDKVLIGFMNDDTRDFVSLRQGDDCMYYLDEDRRVEFYDQQNSEAWIKFLDKNKQ